MSLVPRHEVDTTFRKDFFIPETKIQCAGKRRRISPPYRRLWKNWHPRKANCIAFSPKTNCCGSLPGSDYSASDSHENQHSSPFATYPRNNPGVGITWKNSGNPGRYCARGVLPTGLSRRFSPLSAKVAAHSGHNWRVIWSHLAICLRKSRSLRFSEFPS